MSDDEKRGVGYGVGAGFGAGVGAGYGGLGGTGVYGGAYGGVGGCGCGAGVNNFCADDYFIQVLCPLKGEMVKVFTEGDEVGVICGRLVTIGLDYIAVSCDGTVAYILLAQITAIIPID